MLVELEDVKAMLTMRDALVAFSKNDPEEAKRLYLAVPKTDRKEWLRRECGIY